MEDVVWNYLFRIGNWPVLFYTPMRIKKYEVPVYDLKAYGKAELQLHSM
jgi:hypothetical protein